MENYSSRFQNARSMYLLLLQYPYISLLVSASRSSHKYNTAPEGCLVIDWQDLMMVLGGAVMKEVHL